MRAGALCFSSGSEEIGEQEAGEVVHGETQLVAIGASLPHALRTAGTDAGVVDEEVEPAGRPLHRAGKSPHLGERGRDPRRGTPRNRRPP